jgi:hypothetical protein
MKKLLLLATLVGAVLSVQADVLFYTDFHTVPAGFKAASDAATAKGLDDTVVVATTGPKDTVIDLCTLSTPKAATAITISKGSQTCVKAGDTAGCTPGRLSLKNSGCSITMPSVTGPCSITYYAASSSTTSPGRGISCLINGTDTPEAGIAELWLNGTAQASRKMVYNYTTAGPVVFTLSSVGGGVYIYDITIESGAASVLNTVSPAKSIQTIQKVGNIIKNGKNARVDVYTTAGVKILTSTKSVIDVTGLTHGIYMLRMAGMNEQIKIVR